MWRSVFKGSITNNRIQRSSSTSSSMDLINEKSLSGYNQESAKFGFNCDNEKQYCIRNSNHRLRMKDIQEKQLSENQQQKQLDDQDNLSIKLTLIESKKKLAKKLHNIKFKSQTQPEKIKRRTYEQFECAVLTNDCNKMLTILKDNPKLNLAHDLRPDGNTFLHTSVRYRNKDALHWLASRYNKSQLNRQNIIGDSALHLAVKEKSTILVDILLNHKACNHVQNMNRETPLQLALSLYIKYRDLKDHACVSNNLKFNDHRIIETEIGQQPIIDSCCFCQKKLFDPVQLETNSDSNSTSSNISQFEHQKENDPCNLNLNKLIKHSISHGLNNSSKLEDLTSTFLNRQNLANRDCCRLSNEFRMNGNALENQLSSKKDIETINNCRVMRKILISILHDSDPSSWQMKNLKGQNVIDIAKIHQVDFVYDFILNYQKLNEIVKPEQQQVYHIDRNGNYLIANNAVTNGSRYINDVPNNKMNLFQTTIFPFSNQRMMKAQVNSNFITKTRATICDYQPLEEEKVDELEENNINTISANETMSKNDEIKSSLTSSSLSPANIKTDYSNTKSITSALKMSVSNISNYRNRNETAFLPKKSAYSENKGAMNGNTNETKNSSRFINHYKRKTDEYQYCLKEQRSIIKQDNLNKPTILNVPSNSINRNRKSIRSRSITLGNINLLDKNHNLFTSSSCSLNKLNKLSELENRNFDYFQNSNDLDNLAAAIGSSSSSIFSNEKTDHLNEEFPSVTYTNIPNDFAAKQQSMNQMNQMNVKTALVSCLSIRMY